MDTFFLADNNELEIKTNIELCEKMLKLFLHDYYRTYYPKRWKSIQKLMEMPRNVLAPQSIAYIPDTKAELAIERGGCRYTIRLAIGSKKTELSNNYVNNPNLTEQENAELLNEINELKVTLSNMAVWAFDMINTGWELPVDLSIKLHEDGAIHFESNNDSSAAIRCRKSATFLYASLSVHSFVDVFVDAFVHASTNTTNATNTSN